MSVSYLVHLLVRQSVSQSVSQSASSFQRYAVLKAVMIQVQFFWTVAMCSVVVG